MNTGGWSEQEEPDIAARHLLLCREVVWNSADAEARYSLLGLLTDIRPKGTFPLVWDRPMYAFVQFFGSPGEYEVWIEVVRLIQDEESGEFVDETEAVAFGPFEINVPPRPSFTVARSRSEKSRSTRRGISSSGFGWPECMMSLSRNDSKFEDDMPLKKVRGPRQPGPLPRGVKSAPEEFVVCYPPTEDGHLTEEQKKWPVVTEEWPRDLSPQPAPPVLASEPKPAQAS